MIQTRSPQFKEALKKTPTEKLTQWLLKFSIPEGSSATKAARETINETIGRLVFKIKGLEVDPKLFKNSIAVEKWKKKVYQLLSTPKVGKAVDLMMDWGFDPAKLGSSQIEKMGRIIDKADAASISRLKLLFSKGFDMNTIVNILDKGIPANKCITLVDEILSKPAADFAGRISLPSGASIKIKTFLSKYDYNNVSEYFHKQVGDAHVFVKYVESAQNGVATVIGKIDNIHAIHPSVDDGINFLIDGGSKGLVVYIKGKLDETFKNDKKQ